MCLAKQLHQLTETQVKLLKRLANGKVKIYVAAAGVPRDKRCDEMNIQFNEILQLVEIGLLNDVSDAEKFAPIVKEYWENERRDVAVVWIKLRTRDVRKDTVGEANKLSTKEKAKDKRLREVYNTTLEAQNAQRSEQKDACAICRRPFSQFQSYQDHDHACCPRRLKRFCGKCNRGLLCYLCNKKAVAWLEFLDKVGIDVQRVVDYIPHWRNIIKLKGGYAPKEKRKVTRRKVARK